MDLMENLIRNLDIHIIDSEEERNHFMRQEKPCLVLAGNAMLTGGFLPDVSHHLGEHGCHSREIVLFPFSHG
jgi:predicted metal-dependent RNase